MRRAWIWLVHSVGINAFLVPAQRTYTALDAAAVDSAPYAFEELAERTRPTCIVLDSSDTLTPYAACWEQQKLVLSSPAHSALA